MATKMNIGSDPAEFAQSPPVATSDDTVSLYVPPGTTVNVAVVGSTVNYWSGSSPNNSSPTGTITTGNNQNFVCPSGGNLLAFLQSQGFSALTITGGNY